MKYLLVSHNSHGFFSVVVGYKWGLKTRRESDIENYMD